MFEVKETETLDKLVLDFDAENKKELLSVDTDLVAKMKPHQVRGMFYEIIVSIVMTFDDYIDTSFHLFVH